MAAALLALSCAGAAADEAETAVALDPAAVEFFEKSVRPLLVKHCQECHTAGEANGGLALDSRSGVLAGGDSGPALVPGKPDASRLIEAVRYQNLDLQMPPQGRLSDGEIAALEKWISLGAPDPRVATAADTAAAPSGMSIEAGRQFWAFQPVGQPDVPPVRRKAWVRNPIDAFVLARLEATGLKPAPRANRRTLIRRVTFDLTGLPPTPDEIDAFLRDDSPEAYAHLVERLLHSPDYGVRWGRHWLDVARYADSNGLDENLAFGNAWRYRDYVVEAFNQDKPFNQFLIEQLAGDLLPEANEQTHTATGFLVLGAKVLAEPDREKLEMDTIDEQLDTLGKAFLGMTLGCVRCHDHKFDPLKQTDYYALAAIFKSTKTFDETKTGSIKHWHERVLIDEAQREAFKKIDEEIAEKNKAASNYKREATTRLRAAARAQATEYLMAAAGFEPAAPLTRVADFARPLGLHPHILHHCRLHLEYHRDDELWLRWHELAAVGDVAGIEQHYRPLIAAAEQAWAEARKADPKVRQLDDPQLDAVRAALDDTAGLLAVPTKPEFAFDAETLAEYHRLADEARRLESAAPDVPAVMSVTEADVMESLPIHIRGSHRNLGPAVARGVPEVMQSTDAAVALPADQSGRLELARWLADERHPLTARVYVNRLWRWHFGTGLVASTDNFGLLGDRPSHPELLDWLARQLVESGWSTRAMHRQIVLSNTYQMASTHPRETEYADIDPENRQLWKFPLQRLEAEAIRDAVLAVTGRLERQLGGKTIPLRNKQFVFNHTSVDHTRYDSLRRAIYLPVVRNNLYTLFEQFDFPDPTMPTGHRNTTTVAPQALLLLNADLVIDSAEAWAEQLLAARGTDAGRLRRAYLAALGRPPTQAEIERAVQFVDSVAASAGGDRRQAWALLCQSLLASNEFIYLR